MEKKKEELENMFDVKIEHITQEEINALVKSINRQEEKGNFELQGIDLYE